MKLKPIYIYASVIIIALLAIIIIDSNNSDDQNANVITSEEKMPNDDIHKSLGNTGEEQPSGENVITDIRTKMNDMGDYVRVNPNDTAKVKEYADLLAAAHNPQKAIELYNSILEKDSKRIDILSQLARVYFIQKKFDDARSTIKKIIKIDPENVEALYNLGVIAANEGKTEQAIDYWQNIIDKYPNSETAKLAENSLKKL